MAKAAWPISIWLDSSQGETRSLQAQRDDAEQAASLAQEGTPVFVSTHFMDEADYCGRLGIMSEGRLLAMDSPSSLMRDTLPGPAWNLMVDRLIPSLEAMQRIPGVFQVGLRGDHLHAVTLAGQHTADSLQLALSGLGFAVQVEPADATLEDVFIALAGRNAVGAGISNQSDRD